MACNTQQTYPTALLQQMARSLCSIVNEGLPDYSIWAANVKRFGAVGNGVTDDRAAIVAAIDSVAATGGVVYFPPGRYYTSSSIPITYSTGITLQGTGVGSEVLSLSAAEGNKFAITGSNVTIQGLKLNGGYSGGGQAGDFGLIDILGGTGTTIRSCTLVNSSDKGIRIVGLVSDVLITQNEFGQLFCSINSISIDADNVPQRIVITENDFGVNWSSGSQSGGIKILCPPEHFGVSSSHIVSDNRFLDTGQMGIELWGGVSDCSVIGNVIEDVEFGISLDSVKRSSCVGNTIRRVTYCGIENATACEFNVISSNVIDGRDADGNKSAILGLITSSNPGNRPSFIKFLGNSVMGINGPGIQIQTSDDIDVVGNLVRDCEGNGVTLNGSNRVTVKSNTFIGEFDSFFFVDSYDEDVTAVEISSNTLIGNAEDNTITIFDGGGVSFLDNLLVANNNVTQCTTSANSIFTNWTARTTNLTFIGNSFIDIAGNTKWPDGGSSVPPFSPSQQGYGFPVAKTFDITVPTNASAQWFKIFRQDFGSPIVIWVNVRAFAQAVANDADNVNAFFGAAPFGFGSSGMLAPHTRYEDGIVEEIIYNNPNGTSDHEIWVKIKPTVGSYTMGISGSQYENGWITSPSFVTVEPTWGTNLYKLPCNYSGLTTKNLRITDLPTASAGLPTGTIWSDSGTLKVA